MTNEYVAENEAAGLAAVDVHAIVAQVSAGQNVRLPAGPQGNPALAELASRLGATRTLIRVTAPAGGLTLSRLIAQLAEVDNFDDQDDAALERAFGRLTAPRAVLLLDAATGVQRPVLRYLQQTQHVAPDLVLVIRGPSDLDRLLEEPGLNELRRRLSAPHRDAKASMVAAALPVSVPPVVSTSPETLPVPPVMAAPVSLVPPAPPVAVLSADRPRPPAALPADWTLKAPAGPSRRSSRGKLVWAASGAALAASVAVGLWLGQMSSGAEPDWAAGRGPVRLSRAAPELHLAETLMPPSVSKEAAPQAAWTTTPAAAHAPAPVIVEPQLRPSPALLPPAPHVAGRPAPSLVKASPAASPARTAQPELAEDVPASSPARAEPSLSLATAAPDLATLAPTQAIKPGSVESARRRQADARPIVAHPRARALELRPAQPNEQPSASAYGDLSEDAWNAPNYARRQPYDRWSEAAPISDERAYLAEPAPRRRAGWMSGSEPVGQAPIIGTFSAGPNGTRVFRYAD